MGDDRGQEDSPIDARTDPEDLRASDARFRAIFESIDDGYCLIQLLFDAEERATDYRFLQTNPAFENHSGLKQAVGKTIYELVPNMDDSWPTSFGKVALTGKSLHFENHAAAMNKWFEVYASRVSPPELRQVALVFKDITRRKLAEQERNRALERVSQIIENMGDGFFAVDADGRFVLVNSKYERVTGSRREDLIGRTIWECFPEKTDASSQYWQKYHECKNQKTPVQFVDAYPSLDLWTDVRAHPTPEGGIAVFLRDVSEEKSAQAAFKKQSEFEQQLVGIVSHDLRNPLAAIALATQSILRRTGLDERVVRSVRRIQSSTQRAMRLVHDLLDFTKARLGGGIPMQRQAMDLEALARNTVEELRSAAPERDLRLKTDGDLRGEWDGDRLTQVIVNLTTNALKYSPAATPVTIRATGADGTIGLSVHNMGPPIAADIIEKIFEPMQQGGETSERQSGSVGLGLFIVKHLIAAHGGNIGVVSTEAEGTTFQVQIPRVHRTAQD